MCGTSTERAISLDTIPLHATDFLTLLDQDGVIRYEGPSIERVLGFDRNELVGEHFIDAVHPDERGRVARMIRGLIETQTETVEAIEYRREGPDGGYIWLKSTGATEPTDDGHYVINTTDLTERRRRKQDAVATNEQLYEFAKVVSHDLRNPLNVASGNVKLLREEIETDSERNEERLETAVRAHERMGALIEDLLTLTQSGSQINDLQWVGFGVLCETCWRNVATANAAISVAVDGEIRADRSRLQQLIENLIRNAVEHGGEDVTVTVGELDDADGFYLADDGPGIERPNRDRVFESGFSTAAGGTGFGLAIVGEVVEAHGWRIDVTESRDGGARFEISGVDWRSENI